jgi:hypothetical protein
MGLFATLSITVSRVIMLIVPFYCYAECHYAECLYAECRGASNLVPTVGQRCRIQLEDYFFIPPP